MSEENTESDNQMENNDSLIQSLRESLKLEETSSVSLSKIVDFIKSSFVNYDASSVHNCLVQAFPDLQAQQSKDKEEIYYLGIGFVNNELTNEGKLFTWIKQRFKEEVFGKISTQTVIELATKELGILFKSNVLWHYLRKAFPAVYIRRSDRLRWWCGITLPDQKVTHEDKKVKVWLQAASKWVRENLVMKIGSKEQCSLIFSAICHHVSKASYHQYITAVKSVFPNVMRKSFSHVDYYVGISFRSALLRETVLSLQPVPKNKETVDHPIESEEERNSILWVRENLVMKIGSKEQCSLIFSAICHHVSKASYHQYITAVKSVFPNVMRKSFSHVDYYVGISFRSALLRETVLSLQPVPKNKETVDHPIESEEERNSILWLRAALKLSLLHREKLSDVSLVLSNKLSEHVTEKGALKMLRKAFPTIRYRKRVGQAYVIGIKILEPHRPRDYWLEKSLTWLKEVIIPSTMDYCEKSSAVIDIIKTGTKCNNRAKCVNLLRVAFPRASFRKTINGQQIYGIRLRADKLVEFPVCAGDNEPHCDNFTCAQEGDIEASAEQDASCHQEIPAENNCKSPLIDEKGHLVKLEQKVDRLSTTINEMRKDMLELRNVFVHSSRQKDALITQQQQTIILLSQQHYQRMLKPNELVQQGTFGLLSAVQTFDKQLSTIVDVKES